MTAIAVLCDGVEPAQLPAVERTIRVSSRHNIGNVHMLIQSPAHALGANVLPVSSDLLKLAAYVYGVDQEVSRGGSADIYGEGWRRDFYVHLPVSDRVLWERASASLSQTLDYVTGDRWFFTFTQAVPAFYQPVSLAFEPNEVMGNPDSVYMLSGGLDSLCAVVEALASGRRPLLIGHAPAKNIGGRRRAVVAGLRQKFGERWSLPDINAAISRTDLKDPNEYTQRSRGFLFGCLASVFAQRLNIQEVNLSDNGVVSLNLPLNGQVVNTRASRSTHPKFLRLFNIFLADLFDDPPHVVNPLLFRTRPETLEMLKAAGVADLAARTVSCVHTRLMKAGKDHCGVCSQCIDRRFALVAGGLDSMESPNRYVQDIFLGELTDGHAVTMTQSYYRFVQGLMLLSDEDLFGQYPELYDAVSRDDLYQQVLPEQLASLLHRHAGSAIGAIETLVERNKNAIAMGTLPETSLIRLINPPTHGAGISPVAAAAQNGDWHTPDFRRILWEGEWLKLSTNRARVVQYLSDAQAFAEPGLSQETVLTDLGLRSRNLYQVFRDCWAWQTLVIEITPGFYALSRPS